MSVAPRPNHRLGSRLCILASCPAPALSAARTVQRRGRPAIYTCGSARIQHLEWLGARLVEKYMAVRINWEAHFKNAYESGTLGSSTIVGVPRVCQSQLKDPLSAVFGSCMIGCSLGGGHVAVGESVWAASLLRAPGTIDLPRFAPPAPAPALGSNCARSFSKFIASSWLTSSPALEPASAADCPCGSGTA